MSTAEATLSLVRANVQRVLRQSAAFCALPPDRRRQIAHDTVKAARFMVDGGGATAGVPMSARVATGLAGPNRAEEVRSIGRGQPTAVDRMGRAGAAAARSGGQALTDIIGRVDFPSFVGGLVEGTFNAIVNASIQQMEAYSNLVANIAKSVDEYMRDNITENQARDYLAAKYPDHLKVDTSRGQPRLVPVVGARGRRDGAIRRGRGALAQSLAGEASPFPDFMKELGLPAPVTRLDARTAEEQLMPAARRRMAMDRQQLLATMVLMGINRLIVTDGKISASCLFELDTTDAIYESTETASSFDETVQRRQRGWRFWFIPSEVQRTTSKFTVSTVSTSDSESSVNLHAQLAGNVDINFRSETFPLEQMADVLQIREIEQKAPAAAAPAPQRPAVQLPPPPPLPPLPGAPGSAPPAAAPAPGGEGT